MAQGFAVGVIWGVVVSGVGAGALSLATGLPEPAPAPMAGIEAPDMTSVATDDAEVAVVPGMDDSPVVSADLPDVTEPSQEAAPETAMSPATPEVGAAPDTLDAPSVTDVVDGDVAVTLSPLPDAPVRPAGQSTAPGAPKAEGDPAVADAAAPVPSLEDAIEEGMEPSDEQVSLPIATEEPAPVVDTTPNLMPEPAPEDTPLSASDSASPETVAPLIGRTVGSLVDRKPAVSQGRLPTIGSAASSSDAAEATAEAPVPTVSKDSPLVQFASPFAAEEGVPRMAIVLIDTGDGPMGPAELETFPFPVSFAIAPSHPDPTAAAQGYRERGFEVLALADVPDGATASDVEVTLGGLLDLVPGAVGVLEDPAGGLQDNREIAAQSAAYLGASGHGIVMLPKGLNVAQKLAVKEGVPSVSLFRDLDSEGQDQGLIRRTLDQAAFRARQEGAVVMLGRIRADTISALLLWGLQDRGTTITLVPISTVLRESVEQPVDVTAVPAAE